MRRLFLLPLAAALPCLVPALAAQAPLTPMLQDVRVLASDSLGGRFTGSPEALKAAAYVAARFKAAGLVPAGSDWFQPFKVNADAPAMKSVNVPFGLQGVNVIGFLPGRDKVLRDELVIVGAHYDHLGLGHFDSARDSTLAPHVGADDNASGTASLIHIAERLKRIGTRRSVLFIAFSGEELGLLGSSYYVKHPVRPLAQTVAMINLDMVGRLRNEKLIVYGTGTAKEFPALLDSLNATAKFDLRSNPDGYGPSDHSSFYGQRRPVLHLFTDLHDDYHRASDTWDKINAPGMEKVADFAADIVHAIADRSAGLTVVEQQQTHGMMAMSSAPAPSNPGAAPRSAGYGAWFGSIPDMGGGGTSGVLFSGVGTGSPAEKAGLKGGDVLVKIGDNAITDLQSMTDVLRTYKPGDSTTVVVLRDGKELSVPFTFGQRSR